MDNDVENIGNYKVGDHVQVKLSGGRIVQATIKVVVETTGGRALAGVVRCETALIYPWQIVIEAR
jgi:small nuclear ribonucleoprotein (snRNP)-like protein